jgi:hypothetical protein
MYHELINLTGEIDGVSGGEMLIVMLLWRCLHGDIHFHAFVLEAFSIIIPNSSLETHHTGFLVDYVLVLEQEVRQGRHVRVTLSLQGASPRSRARSAKAKAKENRNIWP